MYEDLIAGCVAGSSGIFVGYPLDTLKTRIQTSSSFSGVYATFKHILKNEGLFSLYKGLSAPFLTAGLTNSLLFAGYTGTLKFIHGTNETAFDKSTFSIMEIIFASSVGAALQLIPGIPVELTKTKLQVQRCSTRTFSSEQFHCGPIRCALGIIRQNGFRGLYQGGTVMFWRDMIGYLFYIPTYEFVLHKLRRETNLNETLCQVLAGGTAGSVSWWSICPLELIKNRLQTQEEQQLTSGLNKDRPSLHNKKSALQIAKQIYFSTASQIPNETKFRTFRFWLKLLPQFYSGGLILAIRAFPVNSVVFLIYERTSAAISKSL